MMSTQPRTFRCANCNEMINDSMTQCRYCSVPIDHGIATLLADRQDKANQAYSDASYLRNAAVAMYVFLGVGLIFAMAYWGFVGAFVVVTVLLIRWQWNFSDLLTNDPDYETQPLILPNIYVGVQVSSYVARNHFNGFRERGRSSEAA